MNWIDTHAHLFDNRFRQDLPQVLSRAKASGLVHILAVGIDHESNLACVELAKKHPDILFATVGIQPNHVAESNPKDWDEVVRLAQLPEVKGIGETGLDRYWDRTPFAQQEDYFARHLALSRQTEKPLVIHAALCGIPW
jgi:TatD DNase family protein